LENCLSLNPSDPLYPSSKLLAWFSPLPNLITIGNLDILRLKHTALFCSRKCPGDAIVRAYDLSRELREKETPVISGFHTPVEKDMLEILFKGKGPIVICPARGLNGMRIPKPWIQAILQGRLLLLSIFDQHIHRATKETAHQRNLLVAALAKEYVFIHIEPGGETEKVANLISSRVFLE